MSTTGIVPTPNGRLPKRPLPSRPTLLRGVVPLSVDATRAPGTDAATGDRPRRGPTSAGSASSARSSPAASNTGTSTDGRSASWPHFPNLYLLYGPNTNLVINGSIIYFSECAARYILGCIRLALEHGGHALEVRQDVHDACNQRVDARNAQMAWGISTVNSWYKNAAGHITQNWPFTLLEYWERTRQPDPADYQFIDDPTPPAPHLSAGAIPSIT